jgi:hypothetical protein
VVMAAGHRPCSREAAVACGSPRPRPGFGCAPHTCHVAVPAATHAVSTPVAGEREATGYCPGRQSAVDTGMAIDTSLARCAGHQPSGERSLERPFRKQRTVNR